MKNFFTKTNTLYCLAYLVLAVLCMLLTRFVITTPDTFNYLLMAEQVARGDWWTAVSSHWGVGIAVLIAPLLKCGMEAVVAFKLVQLVIGFFAFILFLKTIRRFALPEWITGLSLFVILPLILEMSLELTADLLLVTLLLWYFYLLSDSNYGLQKKGWLCGLAGGLAYLSKAYAFPFFVVHFTLWNVVLLLPERVLKRLGFRQYKRKIILHNLLGGWLVFVAIAALWAVPLSQKFGEPSIGMAGKYNLALISPQREHQQLAKDELIDPQTEFTEYWVYEEPGLFVHDWSPFGSKADVQYYVEFLMSNVVRFCYIDYARHLVLLLLILTLCLFFRRKPIPKTDLQFIILTVLTVLVFTGGYFLVLVRERYFWLDYFLGLFAFFLLLKYVLSATKVAGTFVVVAAFILMSDSCISIYHKIQIQPTYRQLHAHIDTLKPTLEEKRVATNDIWGVYHHTDMSVYLMYYTRCQFWGQIRNQRLRKEGLQEAQANKIDYFIVWDSPDLEQSVFREVPVIFRDTSLRMTIYALNSKFQKTNSKK